MPERTRKLVSTQRLLASRRPNRSAPLNPGHATVCTPPAMAGTSVARQRCRKSVARRAIMPTMSTHEIDSLDTLRQHIRNFALARAWERYHTPKNLAMALSVEAAELLEPFQWLTAEQSGQLSPEQHEAVRQEIADVLIYLT